MYDKIFFIASFLVSSSRETVGKKNRWFRRGAIVESARGGGVILLLFCTYVIFSKICLVVTNITRVDYTVYGWGYTGE